MKRLIILTALIAAFAAICYAEVGVPNLQSVTRLQTGTHGMSYPRGYNGVMAIQPSAVCSAFINATTLTRTKATVGYPMAASTQYIFNVPSPNKVTFTCATSAAVKYIYIAR